MGKEGLRVEGMGLGVGEDPCSAFLGKRNPQGCSQGPCEPHESSQELGSAAPRKFGIPRAGSADPCGIQLWDAPCEELPEGLLGFRDRSGAMGAAADAEWLRWVSKQFGNVTGKEKEISLEEFKSALQVKEVRDPWEKWRDPWEKGSQGKGVEFLGKGSVGKGISGKRRGICGKKEWDPWQERRNQ